MPKTKHFGDTKLLLHFDGMGDYLSCPDSIDWSFDYSALGYSLLGNRHVYRGANIKREFYSLKRLGLSDYYVIN